MSPSTKSQLTFFDPTVGAVPGPRELERQATRPLVDDAARERIRRDLDSTLFVEAAAGAGKTTALVSRMVSLIGAGRTTLKNIVAVTFTERAAGEMKLRLRTGIEEARREAGAEVRPRYDAAVEGLELTSIGTIHSFCADILRARPIESRIDPRFSILPESDAARLLDRAFDHWFEAALEDPPEGVRRVLRRPPRRRPWTGWRPLGPRQELRGAVGRLAEHRDFDASWNRDESFDRTSAIDRAMELLRELASFAENANRPASWLCKGFLRIAGFVDEVDARANAAERDHDRLEAEIRELLNERGAGWGYSGPPIEWWREGLRMDDLQQRREEIRGELEHLLTSCDADLAARLRDELRPVICAYEELKRREGALDFLDLLLKARDLIREDPEVRRDLQARYSHVFTDEFQDTDPLQAEILLLLSADDPDGTDYREVTPVPGKLFLVGDPKQSIYSFRRADVRFYEETKRRLVDRGAELVRLTTSFRSVPGIQNAVNAAFSLAIEPAEDGSQAAYVPLERFRDDIAGQPAVVALPAPNPYSDYGKIVRYRIDESYADAVGAFVAWLLNESDWKVTEVGRPDRLVPIQSRHICILTRRLQSQYKDVMRPYLQALENREIPHVLIGGKGFHDREEVQALRSGLQAIEWPDDSLSVYATLRGPFFALTDGQLLAFRNRNGALHPLAPRDSEVVEEGDIAVQEALEILAELHRFRNRRPVALTLSRFLASVRAHAGLAMWPAGEQALANCLRLVDRAREFERNGAFSFRAFVEMMEDEAEKGEGEDAPIVEEGTQGVRIMTVHRAKGLEFPVVILADPTHGSGDYGPSQHVDPAEGLWAEQLCGAVPLDVIDNADDESLHEAAEAVRLAYVAATRARDLLVLPAVGDGAEPTGWAESLNPVIYPSRTSRRESSSAASLGCPDFGEDSVRDRPHDADASVEDAVKPGLHTSRAGTTVVWWDPVCLVSADGSRTGVRQEELLRSGESGGASRDRLEAHERWRTGRGELLGEASRIDVRVVRATTLAADVALLGRALEVSDDDRVPDIEVQRVECEVVPTPRGRRYGELVHRVLATVDLTGDLDAIHAAVRIQARVLGVPESEQEAAAEMVRTALRHPLVQRAAAAGASGSLRRETPISFFDESSGSLVEGVVDLAFREADGERGSWIVIDFKTDREVGDALSAYKEQVRLYVKGLRASTGDDVRGVLLLL